jgi:hypothetical protein
MIFLFTFMYVFCPNSVISKINSHNSFIKFAIGAMSQQRFCQTFPFPLLSLVLSFAILYNCHLSSWDWKIWITTLNSGSLIRCLR